MGGCSRLEGELGEFQQPCASMSLLGSVSRVGQSELHYLSFSLSPSPWALYRVEFREVKCMYDVTPLYTSSVFAHAYEYIYMTDWLVKAGSYFICSSQLLDPGNPSM